MAGIDKIYGSQDQYWELFNWLSANKPGATHYLYPPDGYEHSSRPISNFSEEIDIWLWENCPLEFVLKRLTEQYGWENKKALDE